MTSPTTGSWSAGPEEAGHDVTVAENGAPGLQAARDQGPDLVVTDVMMPVMTALGGYPRITATASSLTP
jgi:CheY-like chemotaxis protein